MLVSDEELEMLAMLDLNECAEVIDLESGKVVKLKYVDMGIDNCIGCVFENFKCHIFGLVRNNICTTGKDSVIDKYKDFDPYKTGYAYV